MKIANSTEIDPIFQNLMDYYAERNLMWTIIFGLYLTCAITWKCWVKCYAGCAQMCQNPDRTATTAQRVSQIQQKTVWLENCTPYYPIQRLCCKPIKINFIVSPIRIHYKK